MKRKKYVAPETEMRTVELEQGFMGASVFEDAENTESLKINNQEVDLTENGSWVMWDNGYNINGNFVARAWFRNPTEYSTIIQFSNTNGQTIKLNFMMGYENVESADMQAYVEAYVESFTDLPYYIYSNYVTPIADSSQYVIYLTQIANIYSLTLLTT